MEGEREEWERVEEREGGGRSGGEGDVGESGGEGGGMVRERVGEGGGIVREREWGREGKREKDG